MIMAEKVIFNGFFRVLGYVMVVTAFLLTCTSLIQTNVTDMSTKDESDILSQTSSQVNITSGTTPCHRFNVRTLATEHIQPITVDDEEDCKNHKFLVYRCDKSSSCGGLADREKGIVTAFLLSFLSNRTFVIEYKDPCELTKFVRPNIYNWTRCSGFLSTTRDIKTTTTDFVGNYAGPLKEALSNNFDIDLTWQTQVVVLKINRLLINSVRSHKNAAQRLKWLLNTTNEETVHLVLHSLFKPLDFFCNDITSFFELHFRGRKSICSHIRLGRNIKLKQQFVNPNRSLNKSVLFNFLEKYDNAIENAIYIASDSVIVRNYAKNRFHSCIDLNRTVIHVDNMKKKSTSGYACNGLYTALLEHYILSQCDLLVLTPSGFGFLAAYLRGHSENLYIYYPGTFKIFHSKLSAIQNVYHYF